MTNHPMLPRITKSMRSLKDRIVAVAPLSLCALTLTSLLGGCAAMEPQHNLSVERPRPMAISAASFPVHDAPRIRDEIRLIDTRVIRKLRQPQPYQGALPLTDAQKKVVIIGGAIVGAYLISEWLEDNLPLPPGP